MRIRSAVVFLVSCLALPAAAQTELSFYGGYHSPRSSTVSGNDSGGIGQFSFDVDWRGHSVELPPYFGVRLTWWQNARNGWGVEMNHAQIVAGDSSLSASGLNELRLSDGLNLLTVNRYRRWQIDNADAVPYVGAGLGIAVPSIEFDAGGDVTSGRQFSGPAVQWVAGMQYPISDRWSVFGEYKGSASANSFDLENGGNLDATVFTSAVNVGLSLGF